MIRNLIFDLGGVILNYDVEADTRALAQAGLPEYASWDRYPELGKIANLYLNGLISDAEFCTRIDPYCTAGTSDSVKLYSMQAVLADIPRERLEAIRALRGKYRIHLLSNINHLSWEYALEQFDKAGIAQSRIMVATFSVSALKYFQTNHPEIRRVGHIGAQKGGELYAYCRELGLWGVNMPVLKQQTTSEDIRELKRRGLWVSLWFVQNRKMEELYRDAGMDAYVTDYVSRVRKQDARP